MDYKLRIEFVGDGFYKLTRGTVTRHRLFEDMSDEERRGVRAINAVAMELGLPTTAGIVVEIPL